MNTHEQLVKDLLKPAAEIQDDLGAFDINLIHCALGLAGEIGEVTTAANISNDEFVKELGDFEFYFEGLNQSLGRERQFPEVKEKPQYTLPALMEATLVLVDDIKKMVINGKDVNINKSVQNVEWALAKVYKVLEHASNFDGKGTVVTREDVLQVNINKLSKRYPAGSYSDADAAARKDVH